MLLRKNYITFFNQLFYIIIPHLKKKHGFMYNMEADKFPFFGLIPTIFSF